VDGTIKRRFQGTKVRKRAWMKTGTLKRVKNIAGYVKSRKGKYYTVVIIVNTKKGRWRAAKLENDIIKWLVDYKGVGTKRVLAPTPSKKNIDTGLNRANKQMQKRSASSTNEKYYIQAVSLSHPPSDAYLDRLRSFGLNFKVKEKEGYKVLIGPYIQEKEARKILEKVKKSISKNAFLVKLDNDGLFSLY
jgi:D-alanyl-D-alanine carboxypeptidase/D-alanyl-D-alanine-endopeptidase (penicillin-binding protein 4)